MTAKTQKTSTCSDLSFNERVTSVANAIKNIEPTCSKLLLLTPLDFVHIGGDGAIRFCAIYDEIPDSGKIRGIARQLLRNNAICVFMTETAYKIGDTDFIREVRRRHVLVV